MKIQQVTECLQDKIKAKMKVNQERKETQMGSLSSWMDVNQAKTEANSEQMIDKMKAHKEESFDDCKQRIYIGLPKNDGRAV
jgi:hypothetical protein